MAPWLWFIFVLFCGRVAGQMVVAAWDVDFLPPFEEWNSGLIPYPLLLAAQFLIILLMAVICMQFTRGRGWFVDGNRRLGKGLAWFGAIYLAVMVGRYIVRMALYPEERWVGGSIPIFFHWLLATYVLLIAWHNLRQEAPLPEPQISEEDDSTSLQVSRRRTLQWALGGAILAGTGFGLGRFLPGKFQASPDPLVVNDIHAQVNEVRVAEVFEPSSLEQLYGFVRRAKRERTRLAICGSRHAMGGQQFLDGGSLIDTRKMNTVIDFDPERGLVDVETGIEWPELLEYLLEAQPDQADAWTIPTKQTGADRLSVGGALAANVHGRTLTERPFIEHVESVLLVNGDGELVSCSRSENPELFSLAIGGYGLFGVIHSVVLRLAPRRKLRRVVDVIRVEELSGRFAEKIANGFLLGDFQFATDEKSPGFLKEGVFSCYEPVDPSTPIPEGQDSVSERAWEQLVYLAHTDKSRAYELYRDFYLKTSGQIYWSDTSQLGAYAVDYHKKLDRRMRSGRATEMITELYVPRERLADFMIACAESLPAHHGNVIYGTIRLIEKDEESFLAWAKQSYACVIFNLHIEHSPEGLRKAAGAFQHLIDLAIERGGSYYLTYHRWARKDQVLACYPQFPSFLERKLHFDPEERFQSEWYRHYRQMFAP
jgi:FAD/FMN-containing dehydrogenase